MRLESGGRAVELRPLGYEFPDMVATGAWDHDANWLQIEGDVRDGDLAWRFHFPCMTTWEAQELLVWLRQLAGGTLQPGDGPGGGALWWVEPNVRFALGEQTEVGAKVVVSFSQESSPPGSAEDVRYGEGHAVVLALSREAVSRAAEEWERELAAFPQRRGPE